jgi:hypothetical protein
MQLDRKLSSIWQLHILEKRGHEQRLQVLQKTIQVECMLEIYLGVKSAWKGLVRGRESRPVLPEQIGHP